MKLRFIVIAFIIPLFSATADIVGYDDVSSPSYVERQREVHYLIASAMTDSNSLTADPLAIKRPSDTEGESTSNGTVNEATPTNTPVEQIVDTPEKVDGGKKIKNLAFAHADVSPLQTNADTNSIQADPNDIIPIKFVEQKGDGKMPASDPNGLTTDPEGWFSKIKLSLTPEEIEGLKITENWRETSNGHAFPITGPVGQVVFIYGCTAPSIVCQPLQVTDIALEPGENVESINIGDNGRWKIDQATSGSDANIQPHLIVKPFDVGLRTSLVVTTDRRSYYFTLKSLADRYMQRASFLYPDSVMRRKQLLSEQEQQALALKKQQQAALAADKSEADVIKDRPQDHSYSIKGKASWMPTSIWNDGVKTYIRLPKSSQEYPTIYALRGKSGLFRKPEQVMINYRVEGDLFVIDFVIDNAVMQIGTGNTAESVSITHGSLKNRRPFSQTKIKPVD